MEAKLSKVEKNSLLASDVMCIQKKDMRDVRVFSFFILDEKDMVLRRAKEVAISLVIQILNDMMNGVYREVQMMSSYSVESRILTKMVKKMWLHVIISLHSMLIYYTRINVIN